MLLFMSTICNLVSAGILRFHLHESPREPQRWFSILTCRILAPMTCTHPKECLLCYQEQGRVTPSRVEQGVNDQNKNTAPATLFSDLTENDLNQKKWKIIAYTMDSFFFWMFLSVELLLTTVVFVLLQSH